jgi:hypothetical protein
MARWLVHALSLLTNENLRNLPDQGAERAL